MKMRTPHTTLHPTFPPAAQAALDAAWDAWDDLEAVAEFRNYKDDDANCAADAAWERYVALKADIEAGLWPKRMVAVGDASGVTAHTFSAEEIADYDNTVMAASIYGQ